MEEAITMALRTEEFKRADRCEVDEHAGEELIYKEIMERYVPRKELSSGADGEYTTRSAVEKSSSKN